MVTKPTRIRSSARAPKCVNDQSALSIHRRCRQQFVAPEMDDNVLEEPGDGNLATQDLEAEISTQTGDGSTSQEDIGDNR